MHESCTLLTLNADNRLLMNRMHKPDPSSRLDQQDKRSVISIEMEDVGRWLAGTIHDASALLQLAPLSLFNAAPAQA